MKEITNEQLGNFGFLLNYEEGFLFEFAQLAESNMYTNKRLCAVYIRQLTESFFDRVIEQQGIKTNGNKQMPSLVDKQRAIIDFYNTDKFRRPEYGRKVFPKFPGTDTNTSPYSRLDCPEGEGDNRVNGELVDPNMKTLYVWDFIRRLGNAGSHPVKSEDNQRWMEEKYICAALNQLCYRLGLYFNGTKNSAYRNSQSQYNPDKSSLASREIYYPNKEVESFKVEGQGILPGYAEEQYYTVVPRSIYHGEKLTWENYINRYFIIRRYEMGLPENVRDYLLQSQKAYLVLQQKGSLKGVARYAVLADLRNSTDYYVTSYEFDVIPLDLNRNTMKACGIFDNKLRLLNMQIQFVEIMTGLSCNHIYHRNLTHRSIKVCCYGDDRFELKIIDFELVKLVEKEDTGNRQTIFRYVNQHYENIDGLSAKSDHNNLYQNIRQYGLPKWDENTTEEEYETEQRKRSGMILCNMLCPSHFDGDKVFESVASSKEIFSKDNKLYKTNKSDDDWMRKSYEVAVKLMEDHEFGLEDAKKELEDLINVCTEDR